MREERPVVGQGTMILPYFGDEVPIVLLADGTRYIPVVALCRILGLRPERHIPRWRRLFLWEHARKLPLQTEKRGTRIVWCLHLGALFFWCSCFNWSLVSPERQVQLREATDAGLKQLEQAHQEMLTRYRQMRHLLFRFLTNYADAQTQLQQVAAHEPAPGCGLLCSTRRAPGGSARVYRGGHCTREGNASRPGQHPHHGRRHHRCRRERHPRWHTALVSGHHGGGMRTVLRTD